MTAPAVIARLLLLKGRKMTDKRLLARLAELGKIRLCDDELDKLTADMKDIIAVMDKVREFDGSSAPYTIDAAGYDVLREDKSSEQPPLKAESDRFKVPKVV